MVAPVAAAILAPGWQPYHLPPTAHDVPIVWTGSCADVGCYPGGDTVEVDPAATGQFRILDGKPTVPLEELVYLHELGHWFDANVMTPQLRERFEAIIRVSRDWSAPPDAPAEQFAQAFALCALYPSTVGWRTVPPWALVVYTYAPTRAIHRSVCRLIASP